MNNPPQAYPPGDTEALQAGLNWPLLVQRLNAWRAAGHSIVFTNGCFDLLHPGHLGYLTSARALGSRLVVGLNTDHSVRRLKGPLRPLLPQAVRARQLGALRAVDAVALFREDTPLQLIQHIQPDFLVKGGDYHPEAIVGRELVEARGGQVVVLPFLPGYSTTALVERIASKNDTTKKQ